jgi:hypothetical protein
MNARAAQVPLYVALVAAALFILGIALQSSLILDAGCATLLLVPLARNIVVVVADARLVPRLIAMVLSCALIALYFLAWSRHDGQS